MSAAFLPPGPPLTPSTAGTATLGQPLASIEPDDARSLPSSSLGPSVRSSMQAARSDLHSPAGSNAASVSGAWQPRTLADAVRQGPREGSSSSSLASQQQQARAPAPEPMGHYQSAVLGLGRPHPKSPQPAAPPLPHPSASPARPKAQQALGPSTAPEPPLPRLQEQCEARPPTEAAQLPRAPAGHSPASSLEQRQQQLQLHRVSVGHSPASSLEQRPQLARTPAGHSPASALEQRMQQQQPQLHGPGQGQALEAKLMPPAQFTLSDGDFPSLAAAGPERRRNAKAEGASPSSSVAVTAKGAGQPAGVLGVLQPRCAALGPRRQSASTGYPGEQHALREPELV